MKPLFLVVLVLGWGSLTQADGSVSEDLARCRLNSRIFAQRLGPVTCEDGFHHFQGTVTASQRGSASQKLQIGSFNLYHLGDNQGFFKDYDFIAEIVNQWDVLSAVELMPEGTSVERNADWERLAQAVKNDQVEPEKLDALLKTARGEGALGSSAAQKKKTILQWIDTQYEVPGYLSLLFALQKRDSSWSLVLAPTAGGESVSNTELSGFYYRGRRVEAAQAQGCGKKVACPMAFEGVYEKLVSRPPFLAGFRSGKFDFVLAAYHARFRESKEYDVVKLIRTAFEEHQNGPGLIDFLFPEQGSSASWSAGSLQILGRWGELKAIVKELGRIRKKGPEKDFILAGDFNLTLDPVSTKDIPGAWTHVLGEFRGADVFMDTPTSISKKNGLSNGYDHMIFNPNDTGECDPPVGRQEQGSDAHRDSNLAAAFDFTNPKVFPDLPKKLARLKTVKGLKEAQETLSAQLASQYRPLWSGERFRGVKRLYDKTAVKKRVNDIRSRLLSGVKKEPFKPHVELLSDHIPIHLTCGVGARDDD